MAADTLADGTETKHAEMRAINERLVIAAIRQQELAEMALSRAENALRSGELYRLLAENFPDGMVLLFDQELRHLLVGGKGLLTLGLSKETLEGATLWENFDPQTCRQLEPAYRAALAGKATVVEVRFPDEETREDQWERIYQVHTLPVLDDQDRVLIGMAVAQDVTDQRQAEETVRWQAYHDPLTGLPNRALLLDRLDQVLAMSKRSGELAALLFLDMNHFKQVNDSLGHAAGDQLLQIVAERLTACLRTQDTVARMGGDEFVVLLPGLQAAGDAATVVQKITARLAEPILIDGREMSVSASVGISLFPNDGRDAASLMKRADAAMYESKQDHYTGLRSYVESGQDKPAEGDTGEIEKSAT